MNKDYKIDIRGAFPGFDRKTCKANPKVAFDGENAVLSYSMLHLTGSDCFGDSYASAFKIGEVPECAIKTQSTKSFDEDRDVYFETTLYYDKKHRKYFSFGCMEHYFSLATTPNLKGGIGVAELMYRIFDKETCSYSEPKSLAFPFEAYTAVVHSVVEENDNGDMLVTCYFARKTELGAECVTILYGYENGELIVRAAGQPISVSGYPRGLCEPTATKFNGKYYMTIRTDTAALLCESDDGFTFTEPRLHRFDDSTPFECYNTMQRLVATPDSLYLVYTRKNGKNDHVFRNRAPLYITRFNSDFELVKAEERVVAPERGARLGNFSVCKINDRKFIVSVAEWMQTTAPDHFDFTKCEKYGSDNTIWLTTLDFGEK